MNLEEILHIKNISKKIENSFFLNKHLVFTGTLISLSREEAKYLAKKKGAKILSSVSRKTDYLILGKKSGSKEQKAKSLGVKVLSEEKKQFYYSWHVERGDNKDCKSCWFTSGVSMPTDQGNSI